MAANIRSSIPHTIRLPTYTTVEDNLSSGQSNAEQIVRQWLNAFEQAISSKNIRRWQDVIVEDGWWRDHLGLSWDLRTLQGLPNITDYLSSAHAKLDFSARLQDSGKFIPCTQRPIEGLEWIESMFSFETSIGSGKGMLRLVQTSSGIWKAHMLYTALQEVHNMEERVGDLRPHGGNNSLQGGTLQGNWYERRQKEIEFEDVQPTVVVVGAGQAGLNIGARLKTMNISCLILDKNERIGDNWRLRYRTLVTHDPVQYTHMAYMPFPTTWPLFTPKDKLADWFESYASIMDLNVWMRSTIQSAAYDDQSRQWSITINRDGDSVRTLKPKHVIFCTGQAGEPKIPTFSGQDTFNGTIYHGSQHKDASFSNVAGKKVIVVGTGNSGHDIAQNFHENGASVSMLQRRGTYVISAKTGLFMLHKGLYEEHGPPTEDADIYGQSLPIPVQFALNVGGTAAIKAAEMDQLAGLEKAGFKLDFGEDGSGIYRKYITRGGGYYIDVGASQLIIDGKIRVVQSPGGIAAFEAGGLVLADGRKLEADVVVLATGFDNMRTTLRKTLGDKVADRAKDVWDLDEEGEVNAMWRPSGHPGLWFMGGSLALCRSYSKLLALQIKAHEAGLVK